MNTTLASASGSKEIQDIMKILSPHLKKMNVATFFLLVFGVVAMIEIQKATNTPQICVLTALPFLLAGFAYALSCREQRERSIPVPQNLIRRLRTHLILSASMIGLERRTELNQRIEELAAALENASPRMFLHLARLASEIYRMGPGPERDGFTKILEDGHVGLVPANSVFDSPGPDVD